MSDENDLWRKLASRVIPERDMREVKRTARAKALDWDDWSQREKEVYTAAFLFPDPDIKLIDHFHVAGVAMMLKGYARTARIVDPDGAVWLVVEGGRPQQA